MAGFDNITGLIQSHNDGDEAAYDQAVELLYAELRKIAHRNLKHMGGNPTMQTTAVVNEAYLKIRKSPSGAENSAHFLNIASKAMRQIIVDYARSRNAEKRGGDIVHVDLDETDKAVQAQADEILLIDDAIQKLSAENERLARVFQFKFFTGLDDDELALAMETSKRTAQRDWMKARAFIADYMMQD